MSLIFGLLLSAAAAIVPTLIYVLIFYWADRYEREPASLLFIAFVWGAIPAVIVSLVGEIMLGAPFIGAPGSLAESLVEGVVVAPVVEELLKGVALFWLFLWRKQEFDGVLDGLLYGALIGFGFAMTENFLYFVGAFVEGGIGSLSVLVVLRGIIFGLNHALYTGIAGIALGFARLTHSNSRRILMAGAGLATAIAVHALHNLGASLTDVNAAAFLLSLAIAAAGFGLILLTVLLSWQHERRCIQQELSSEVGLLLGDEELEQLTDHWRRPARPSRQDRSRRQLLVELAIRKHRLRRLGAQREAELDADIAKIRAKLAETYGKAQIPSLT